MYSHYSCTGEYCDGKKEKMNENKYAMPLQFVDEAIKELQSVKELLAPKNDAFVQANKNEYYTRLARVQAHCDELRTFGRKITSGPEEEREKFEILKAELFDRGIEAIEDFVGYIVDPDEDKDVTENRLNDVYAQMPDDEYAKYLDKYGVLPYNVSLKVEGWYTPKVWASSIHEAERKAKAKFSEADFGKLKEIESQFCRAWSEK